MSCKYSAVIAVLLLLVPGRLPAQSQRASAAFEEGQNAQQRGDLNTAIRLYTEAINADSNLYQAYYQRATALASLNKPKEAEMDFKRVLEIEPKFARAHRALGILMLDRGDTENAARELARAVEVDPKLTGVRVYLASSLLKTGHPADALEHLRVAIAQGDEVPLARALSGLALERTGKLDEALVEYDKAIQLDPSNATAREGRARCSEAKGELSKAFEDFSVAYRSQPSRDVALKLATLHTRAGQPQAAIGIYRMLLLDKSDDLPTRVELARLLAETGQDDEANKEIGTVLKLKPNDSGFQAAAGDVFFKDKPALAADCYRKAVELDPSNNRARVQLGSSLVRSMQYEPALPILTDAIARDQNNYAAHANLATALFKLKRYPESAREFLWVIRAKPDVAASYFFLAISLDKLGDCAQALRGYNEFVRRADSAANKNEVEEATSRAGQLQRLIKEKKCRAPKSR